MLPKFYHDFSAENEFQAQKPTFMLRVLSLKTNMEKTFHDIGSSSSVRHVQHVTMWHMPSSFALNLHDKTATTARDCVTMCPMLFARDVLELYNRSLRHAEDRTLASGSDVCRRSTSTSGPVELALYLR